MRNLDFEKLADVIEGPPYQTLPQSVRPSEKYINDPNDYPRDHPYKPIRYDEVIRKQLRVRPINGTGLDLAKSSIDEMRRFSKNDRARYKMMILQLLDNLDFICVPYHYKKIESKNPMKTVKKYIDDFFH